MPGDDPPYFLGNPMIPLADQVENYMQNAPLASFFNEKTMPPVTNIPFCNVTIQPFDACPRNFVIFDQTHNRSQIMFHPDTTSKFFHQELNVPLPVFRENIYKKESNSETNISASLKEDSDDIDALLSLEKEYNEEYSDDEVSTARTNGVYECNSPDSCSNYERVTKKSKPLKSSGSDKKRHKTRKMVDALRGIVPGGNQMSTVAVLDEAVRYLETLRVEVQKLGVGNSKG